MIFRAALLSASALSLCACQTVTVQSDIDWRGRDDAPAETQAQPAQFEGPGAEWRSRSQDEILARLNRPQREGRARNVIVFDTPDSRVRLRTLVGYHCTSVDYAISV